VLSRLPNLLTLLRIGAVPVLILFLKDGEYVVALVVFLAAGITDGLDGWIAKKFDCVSHLGTILDPLADKMLIVSTYVVLVLLGDLPFWLLLLIGFRDLCIIGGFLILHTPHGPVPMQPTPLSKANTVLQIVLVIDVMLNRIGWLDITILTDCLIGLVALTTLLSGIHYAYLWFISSSETNTANTGSDTMP
jgi:cardiolipin synthase